jgi:acyl-CoA hydrolase
MQDIQAQSPSVPSLGEMPRLHRGAEVHLDEWVAPEYADDRGALRAGKILEWLDVVGVLTASRHCRLPVVTVGVDGVVVQNPVIHVGAHVRLVAAVAHTSRRSIGIRIDLIDKQRADARHPLKAFMTFAAVDATGKALEVPQFIPETGAERVRFREGELRREFRRRQRDDTVAARRVESAQDALWGLLPRALRPGGVLSRTPSPQSPNRSYIHKIELVRTGKRNFHGTLYGGTLMRWVETTASLSARAYMNGTPTRLVGLNGLTFLRPVRPNVFLHVHAVVVHTSSTTVTVLSRVESEDPLSGATADVMRGFLTYAPTSQLTVAPVRSSTNESRATFDEVERWLTLQKTIELEDEAS